MTLKRLIIFLVLLLGGLFTWMWEDSSNFRFSNIKLIKKIQTLTQDSMPKEGSTLFKKIEQEALKIAKLDSNPVETEWGLRQWARSRQESELEDLAKIAQDTSHTQDQRFLALTLLGWSENPIAQPLLEEMAISKIDDRLFPNRSGDFERSFRMMAVEGLEKLSLSEKSLEDSLTRIASQSEESLVVDRAHRMLWHQKGLTQQVQQQDEEALEKVLRN